MVTTGSTDKRPRVTSFVSHAPPKIHVMPSDVEASLRHPATECAVAGDWALAWQANRWSEMASADEKRERPMSATYGRCPQLRPVIASAAKRHHGTHANHQAGNANECEARR